MSDDVPDPGFRSCFEKKDSDPTGSQLKKKIQIQFRPVSNTDPDPFNWEEYKFFILFWKQSFNSLKENYN